MTDQPIQTANVHISGDARVYGSVVGVNTGIINTTIIQAAQIVTSLHQLRAPIADFVGHEQEISTLLVSLHPASPQIRVCAVCGMGGLGKTELALYVAHLLQEEYPDAQLFVSLRGSKTVSARTVADGLRDAIRAFDPLSPLPDDEDSLAALYRGHLSGKRVLILLDDVRDVASVRPFIPPANCALLVTSRTRLSMQHQWTTIDLALLQRNESQRFLESLLPYPIEAKQRDQLLSFCGDLPLAVRVVGSTLADNDALSPTQYLARLRDEARRLRALKFEDEDVYAILGLGDDLIQESNPILARRWRMLGICRAPFDAKTVAALWDEPDEDELTDALALLVRRSMIHYDRRTERYQMHELLRDVARSRRTEQDNMLARLRHAAYFLAIYNEADTQYRRGGEQARIALKVLDAWWEHIRDAVLWIAATPTAETDALCVYDPQQRSLLDIRLVPQELISWCRAASEAAHRRGDAKQEASALQGLGRGYFLVGELDQAILAYQQSIACNNGDVSVTAKALLGLAEIQQMHGNWTEAEATYREALTLFEQSSSSYGTAQCRSGLGSLLQFTANYEEALEQLEQARFLFEGLGDRAGIAETLEHLAFAYLQQGHFTQALQYAQQQVDIASEYGDQVRFSMGLYNVGVIHLQQGAYDQAFSSLQQSIDIATTIGYKRGIVISGIDLAGAFSMLGKYADAYNQLQQALDAAIEIGFPQAVAAIVGNAGELYRQQGHYDLALVSDQYTLQISLDLGDDSRILHVLYNIGITLVMKKDYHKAEQLFQRSVALGRKLKLPHVICEDLYRLAELAVRYGRYADASLLNTEAMEAANNSDRGDIILLTEILNVRMQYEQGMHSLEESVALLTTFLATWSGIGEQAAIYYAMWQLQPKEEARQQAAAVYKQLYEATPTMECYERFQELTGQTPAPRVILPPLRGVNVGTQKTLDEFLEAIDHRLADEMEKYVLEQSR